MNQFSFLSTSYWLARRMKVKNPNTYSKANYLGKEISSGKENLRNLALIYLLLTTTHQDVRLELEFFLKLSWFD